MKSIRLNFLPLKTQDFQVTVFRRKAAPGSFDERYSYYDFKDDNEIANKYETTNSATEGFDPFDVPVKVYHEIVSNQLYEWLNEATMPLSNHFIRKPNDKRNKRIHFKIEDHPKGSKCVWLEPYFLRSKQIWGVLIGFQFVVSESLAKSTGYALDRDILIASGALNDKGQSNLDFYLFKHIYYKKFISSVLPQLNKNFSLTIQNELFELDSFQLKPKQYFFRDGYTSSSAFHGLSKSAPLNTVTDEQVYDFIYLEEDRNYAVALLKGLRGETHSNIFPGFEKLFKTPFKNDCIKGTPLKDFGEKSIDAKIQEIKNGEQNVLPVIIINAKRSIDNEKEYYGLKNKFTNAGIPCQVVTKDLIQNENSLKFSLANIGLQMFAKSGGKPWKMKAPGNDYLIIGIGQSYNVEKSIEGNTIEKNIT